MTKPFTEWTVLPHGKLARVDDNLLSVVGNIHMPIGDFPRRMTVVRLQDSRLVIFSAIALDEAEMQALETFGTPGYLIVPSDIHRLDAKVWKDRYPNMKVIAPPGAREAVEKLVHVDQTSATFDDPNVELITVPGTDDLALLVRTASGTTLVINDVIWNLEERSGVRGWLFRVLGFSGKDPKIPMVVRRKIKDKEALRGQLEAWSRIGDLNRIIVSHGNIVTRDPSATLHQLAEKLAA